MKEKGEITEREQRAKEKALSFSALQAKMIQRKRETVPNPLPASIFFS
jgi:hypothetical protein